MSHKSLTKFDQPLLVELKPSRWLLLTLAAVYALVALVWSWVPLPWPGRLLLLALLLQSFQPRQFRFRLTGIQLSLTGRLQALLQ